MIKKLLSTTLVLFFAVSASAVAQVNIGYMDTQQVMREMPEIQQVQDELSTFIEQKQKELSQRATAYQEEVASYQTSRGSMSSQQAEEKEQELDDLTASLEEFDQRIRLEIQQKRQQLLAPVLTKMDSVIAAVAEDENLDFVLNRATNSGENVVFYASGNQKDITQKVINRLTTSSQ